MTISYELQDNLAKQIKAYRNIAEYNDKIHQEFSSRINTISWLSHHRQLIEKNNWGFGDSAFHYMWLLILIDMTEKNNPARCLEIGVFKGQIISLWALIVKKLNLNLDITAISPMKGNTKAYPSWFHRLRYLIDSQYRYKAKEGNLYVEEDYHTIVQQVFSCFGLDWGSIRLIHGLSNDPSVLQQLQGEKFHLIYIDGDHSYQGVTEDIRHFAPMIHLQGYLVMDDASFFLPGNKFWKGHENVSRACEIIPSLGFSNVLNIGHNRIFQKMI